MKAEHSYVVADRRIVSDALLPELSPSAIDGAEIAAVTVNFAPPEEPFPQAGTWFHSWDIPGEPLETSLRLANWTDGYILDFPRYGRYMISRAGNCIRCFARSGIPEATSRHLLLDQVLPFALSLTGDVILHAGAVAFGNDGLAFAAESGRGKSTMVAYLGTQGAEALTDDCLVLRRLDGVWHAIPYYEGVRLWPESLREVVPGARESAAVAHYSGKQRVRTTEAIRFRRAAVPLRMLLFLAAEPDGDAVIELTRLSGRDAFFSTLAEVFFLEREVKPALRNQFENLGQLVEEVPAYSLSYTRRFASLPSVSAAIVSLLLGECRPEKP